VAEQDSENPPAQFLQSLSLNESIVEVAALTWMGSLSAPLRNPWTVAGLKTAPFPEEGRAGNGDRFHQIKAPDFLTK
jgi:hypothetical protein